MMKRSQLGTLIKNEKKRYHAADSSLNFCRKTKCGIGLELKSLL
jgi:hypothetical protein